MGSTTVYWVMYMVIEENISLAQYSTMRLGGEAQFLCIVTNEDEVEKAAAFAQKKGLATHVVGGGSNTIFPDKGFEGLVVVNQITGLDVTDLKDGCEMNIGAGEEWDRVVKESVERGFSDIATLSIIPGTAGAAPIQNIGAYGQQISDSLVSVRAFDLEEEKWQTILRQSCNFSYRSSRFNREDKGRFIVSSLKLQLCRKNESAPFYADIERYLELHNIRTSAVSPEDLRRATIAVREAKLPDPKLVANTGSFFKNPVVEEEAFNQLCAHYPTLKSHKTDDGKLKLYAGQLMELAGFKNYHDKSTGMATWKNQALVLVNENAKTTSDLLDFKKKIITSVHASFGITLEQEPELVA